MLAVATENAENIEQINKAKTLADFLECPLVDLPYSGRFLLVYTDQHLELRDQQQKISPLFVDFVKGAMAHRLQYGGGKGQLLAKAVGLTKHKQLSVLDATLGLGKDAFILAKLGCQVTGLERSKVIYTLLKDALERYNQTELSLTCLHADSLIYLKNASPLFDVIYLDPMFPERKKSALVKKEMRLLKELVGEDRDSNALLELALKKAKKRVVVKRSKLADLLTDKKPDLVYLGKSSRFDVYFPTHPNELLGNP